MNKIKILAIFRKLTSVVERLYACSFFGPLCFLSPLPSLARGAAIAAALPLFPLNRSA